MARSYWFGVVIAVLVLSLPAMADIEIAKTDKHTLTFSGFLKLDATIQDNDMNSLTAPRFATDVATPDGNTTGLTAMHSRFQLKWDGPEVRPGVTIGGVLQWDLFDASRNQMQLRTRLAYMELKGADYSVVAGQHWDIFAAGLPKTTLTNGFYWQTGNVGFRRAQLRYTRNFATGNLAVSLNDPTSNGGLQGGMPIIEARYAWTPAKGVLALSAAYGSEDNADEPVTLFGVAVDGKWKFNDQFSLMGEIYMGENLDIFLSRAGIAADDAEEGADVMGGWIELLYKLPSQPVTLFVGLALENFSDEDEVPAGTPENTLAYFLGAEYAFDNGFSVAGEVTSFTSEFTAGDDSETIQLNLAATYKF